MINLFLFLIIVAIISYAITQIYFNAKTFVGVRTCLSDLSGHACETKSYLLYTISAWLQSRWFIGFCVAVIVATCTYIYTFEPQPLGAAITVILGAAFFSVGLSDILADMYPTSRYPDEGYYGHFYPWHEEAEEEDFQDDPKSDNEGTLLEDGSDSSSVPQQSITVETTQEDESCEQDDTEDAGPQDEAQDNEETT